MVSNSWEAGSSGQKELEKHNLRRLQIFRRRGFGTFQSTQRTFQSMQSMELSRACKTPYFFFFVEKNILLKQLFN